MLQAEIAQIHLSLDQAKPEPLDIKEAMGTFKACSQLLHEVTLDEKETLVDAILKGATVNKDKAVDFEFYVGDGPGYVVQNVKVGSPAWTRTTNILVNPPKADQLSYRGGSEYRLYPDRPSRLSRALWLRCGSGIPL